MTDKVTVKRVWDLPVRLFHWVLVGLIAVSIYTGENGGFNEMDYHMLSGYAILALVLFRIGWGLLGTRHARFSDFVRPTEVVPYLRSLVTDGKDASNTQYSGHNPLGGLSVIAILLVLATQAGTGLFANDDIFLEGPLTHLVDDDMSDQLTSIHHLSAKILYGLIGLHIAAIIFYELVKRQRLILAMITGKKTLPELESAETNDTEGGLVKEIATGTILMAAAASGVYYLINYV